VAELDDAGPESADSAGSDVPEPVDPQDHREAVTELRVELVALLRRSRSLLIDAARAVHPDLDPTAYILLASLADQGTLRGSDLAARHDLDPAAVSRQVRRMVELGLVLSAPDPLDSRAKLLALSDQGAGRIHAVRNRPGNARIADELASWPAEQVRTFAAFLRRYNALLDD
jgi:DNA-binding MarR family transcriptional regulator